MSPNVIEMGRAGNAFLKMASKSSVRHRPWNRINLLYLHSS